MALPSGDFGPFRGRIWLDAAHQGPLPKRARRAARRALREKTAPHLLPDSRFAEVPDQLRGSLARLVNASTDEIILGNSASHGLHLVANGHPWREGDEVLLAVGDFPATLLPWLGLRERGVTVNPLTPRGPVPTPEEVDAALTSNTRVFCVSWVNSYNGYAVDVQGIGEVCRANGVRFVLNATQGLGALTLDVRNSGVDALVSSGFKWLCGPYATGLCWIVDDWRKLLEVRQLYWLALYADGGDATRLSLDQPTGLPGVPQLTARPAHHCDIFGTANFLNFMPWIESIEHLLAVGLANIEAYVGDLVDCLVGGLEGTPYRIQSPPSPARQRSGIVVVSHSDPDRNEAIHRALLQAGVDCAFRNGNIRFSPHLYNRREEIEIAVETLHKLARGVE